MSNPESPTSDTPVQGIPSIEEIIVQSPADRFLEGVVTVSILLVVAGAGVMLGASVVGGAMLSAAIPLGIAALLIGIALLIWAIVKLFKKKKKPTKPSTLTPGGEPEELGDAQ